MRASAPILVSLLLLLGACSAAQEKRLADGSWQIRCGEAMHRCASRADLLCGDDGYEVLGGGTRGRMLGGPNGYRARVQASELVVRCGPDPVIAPEAEQVPEGARDEGAPRSERALGTETAERCMPGATQACVGPGGCSGGQACREDGGGYGPCDCGGQLLRAAPTRSQAPAPAGSEAPQGAAEPSAAEPSAPAPSAPAPSSPAEPRTGAGPRGEAEPAGTAL